MIITSNALLVLEDGSLYPGRGFGATGATVGEVVFTTAMTGYQETLTDPSYHRQIIVSTVAQVGNVGVNSEDPESARVWAAGFVVRALSPQVSNWRATTTLDDYLKAQGVVGIAEVETRALVRHLRSRGVMRGVIAHGTAAEDPAALIQMAQGWAGMDGLDLAVEVSCVAPYTWEESSNPRWYQALPHVVSDSAPPPISSPMILALNIIF